MVQEVVHIVHMVQVFQMVRVVMWSGGPDGEVVRAVHVL